MRRRPRGCEECGSLDDLWEISAGVFLCGTCDGREEALAVAEWDGTAILEEGMHRLAVEGVLTPERFIVHWQT